MPGDAIAAVQPRHRLGPLVIEADRVQCHTRAAWSLGARTGHRPVLTGCFFMAFDPAIQRKIMGQFATGVTVVTTGGKAGLHGLTANAVASLSLDPPLVLVAVDKKSHSLDFLKVNRCFAVNILRLDQVDISRRFAT